MKTNEAILSLVVVLILIAAAAVIGFAITAETNAPDEPHGPMTRDDEPTHYPMDEMIYVPAYPGDECPPEDRVLINTPIRVVDTDGTVYWHWYYENRTIARNRVTLR